MEILSKYGFISTERVDKISNITVTKRLMFDSMEMMENFSLIGVNILEEEILQLVIYDSFNKNNLELKDRKWKIGNILNNDTSSFTRLLCSNIYKNKHNSLLFLGSVKDLHEYEDIHKHIDKYCEKDIISIYGIPIICYDAHPLKNTFISYSSDVGIAKITHGSIQKNLLDIPHLRERCFGERVCNEISVSYGYKLLDSVSYIY